jgi:hypothetical protein
MPGTLSSREPQRHRAPPDCGYPGGPANCGGKDGTGGRRGRLAQAALPDDELADPLDDVEELEDDPEPDVLAVEPAGVLVADSFDVDPFEAPFSDDDFEESLELDEEADDPPLSDDVPVFRESFR